MRGIPFCIAVAALLIAEASAAFTIPVPGDANPNLAGRANGYACCSGDSVPDQSPVLATGIEIGECDTLTFTATGRVSFTGQVSPGDNPDGDSFFAMTNYGDGISSPTDVRTNSLLGVFLGDESPTGLATPPQATFGSPAGIAFKRIFPDNRMIFFIGDGRDSDSSLGPSNGSQQEFVVPVGATRLFLGTPDGVGWFNNSGSFSVTVAKASKAFYGRCGDAADPQGFLSATDSLRVLRVAVGQGTCDSCVCDVDRSGMIAAGDALAVLRRAVGQTVAFRCECCTDF